MTAEHPEDWETKFTVGEIESWLEELEEKGDGKHPSIRTGIDIARMHIGAQLEDARRD